MRVVPGKLIIESSVSCSDDTLFVCRISQGACPLKMRAYGFGLRLAWPAHEFSYLYMYRARSPQRVGEGPSSHQHCGSRRPCRDRGEPGLSAVRTVLHECRKISLVPSQYRNVIVGLFSRGFCPKTSAPYPHRPKDIFKRIASCFRMGSYVGLFCVNAQRC